MNVLRFRACPVCAAREVFLVEKVGVYKMFQCQSCGLEFADPMEYSREAYADAYGPGEGLGHEFGYDLQGALAPHHLRDVLTSNPGTLLLSSYERFVLYWLSQHLPAGGTVLDLGCGSGIFMAYLRARGFRPLGMDPAVEAIDRLSALDFQVARGSIDDMPRNWPDPDAVVMLEVIEHLPMPVEFLRKVARRCSRATLLVSTPSPRRWFIRREFYDFPPNHLTRWTAQSLGQALELAGYAPTVVFPPVIPEDIAVVNLSQVASRGLTLVRKLGKQRGDGVSSLARGGERGGYVAYFMFKMLKRTRRVLLWPFAQYLRARGYSGTSMVGIGVPMLERAEATA